MSSTLERAHITVEICYLFGMDEKWFDRLIETIERDPRGMGELSVAAGLGRNYVQQMIGSRKIPKIDTFIKLVSALGEDNAYFIITGQELSPQDRRLLQISSSLEDEGKQRLIEAFAALVGTRP